MNAAGIVLVCALDLLGRSPERLPPIELVDERPPGASPHSNAFVRSNKHVIYLVTSGPAFRRAVETQKVLGRCGELEAIRMLASVIVHEEWHLLHDDGERGAYEAQLTTLIRLGSGPGRPAYDSVRRAMSVALADEARRLQATRRQLALAR